MYDVYDSFHGITVQTFRFKFTAKWFAWLLNRKSAHNNRFVVAPVDSK